MTNKKENISHINRQSKAFFARGKFRWEKSNAEIWSKLETSIETVPSKRSFKINFQRSTLAIAASLILLIGVGSFLRLYQVSIETPSGQHKIAQLPDGSKVDLNAETTLKYNPFWWRFSRSVKFEGEGYFEVEKGKKFTVISAHGATEVLGTSFNIFSREQVYKVTCLTGSVRVIASKNKTVVLKPNSKAEIKSNGHIEVFQNIKTLPEISWRNNLFMFTATPLRKVFFELERQFGVTIKAQIDSYPLYTGNFSKNHNVEEVLSYVCPALGLDFIRKSEKEFVIIQSTE